MFSTIQGEGHHQGKAAFFIRLGGCDVGCTWCDVKESWDVDAHPLVEIGEIVREAASHPARLAVITGGEPAMHDMSQLTTALREAGFAVHIETSGAYPLLGTFDWITLSPKKFKPAMQEVFNVADEIKVVVFNDSDIAWAEKMASNMRKKGYRRYLQPEWSKADKMMPLIVEHIKSDPSWSISLQIHKYMNIP